MKLGIAVVYLVSERNEPLLNLHLRQIDKLTETPYTIYAAVNGLLPPFRRKLEQNPHVRICPCEAYVPGTGLWRQDRAQVATKGLVAVGSKYEHSWYLEQLIRRAIDDGVSHVAIFHVDSFPVRPGWDSELMGRLCERCVLAGITRDPQLDHKPLTAGILFAREFYLKYRPRLLLSQEQIDSEDYRLYRQACPHTTDSGFGYGFTMFREGLTWYPLVRSNPGGNRTLFASVYGDLIFHLHAAVFIERTNTAGFSVPLSRRPGLFGAGARIARMLVPVTARQRIRRRLEPQLQPRQESADRQAWERERRRLFEDSDRYLMHLRTGAL
jgi:hypothetical protein